MNVNELGRELYDRAGLKPAQPPRGGAARIARALYGEDVIVRNAKVRDEASMGVLYGERRIYVRAKLPARRMNYAIARVIAKHELAKLMDFEPGKADTLAGYLVAPDEDFGPLFDRVRLDLRAISEECAITQTCAALRVHEYTGQATAVITPGTIYRRGLLAWANDEDVRTLAARRSTRSVQKVKITDEPARSAVFARRR